MIPLTEIIFSKFSNGFLSVSPNNFLAKFLIIKSFDWNAFDDWLSRLFQFVSKCWDQSLKWMSDNEETFELFLFSLFEIFGIDSGKRIRNICHIMSCHLGWRNFLFHFQLFFLKINTYNFDKFKKNIYKLYWYKLTNSPDLMRYRYWIKNNSKFWIQPSAQDTTTYFHVGSTTHVSFGIWIYIYLDLFDCTDFAATFVFLPSIPTHMNIEFRWAQVFWMNSFRMALNFFYFRIHHCSENYFKNNNRKWNNWKYWMNFRTISSVPYSNFPMSVSECALVILSAIEENIGSAI